MHKTVNPLFRISVFLRRFCFLLCGAILFSVLGCGQNGRMSVEGTVNLDGKPLQEAQIELIPIQGTTAPTVGGNIIDGKFSIPPDKGPLVGNYQVKIIKAGWTGRKTFDPHSNSMVNEYGQVLPPRYNEQSELKAEVTSSGPNRFEFTLSSE